MSPATQSPANLAPSQAGQRGSLSVIACSASVCSKCGTEWKGLLCLDCARKETPAGPLLKRLRRYGFKVSYHMRQCLRQAAQVTGAIPTECDAEDETIKVSHLFVACDGKTYIGHEWITQGGSSYSWSESYPQNNPDVATRKSDGTTL